MLKRKTGFKRRPPKKNSSNEDSDFYLKVFHNRAGLSDLTGNYLGEPSKLMFHHILPKGSFPQYRYCEWNIALIEPDWHIKVEQSLENVPKIKEKFEELLDLHYSGKLCGCN